MAMPAIPTNLEAFAPLKWATPLLSSTEWAVHERDRGRENAPGELSDQLCSKTLRGPNGITHWVELYELPPPSSKRVTKTITLLKYGSGLSGFPGILHGGATMTLMDEALGYAMVASENVLRGVWGVLPEGFMRMLEEGRPVTEVLNGMLVTAGMNLKFLKPVHCPGVVGIECDILESTDKKIRIKGVMKDGEGKELVRADALWVRIGGVPKL